jgi:uncharacterized protein involved in exopolysaccharide biosynthesis
MRDNSTSAESKELIPLEQFTRIVRYWWLVVLVAVLGGMVGFIISRIKPPVFEAKAVFMASIDFNKIDFYHLPDGTPAPYKLTQYDEDISLVVVEASLRGVIPQVVAFAQQNGLKLDANQLEAQSTIERKNAYWEVRFRNSNPILTQKIVNYWAEQGFVDLKAKQQAGKLPVYIFFDLIQLAELPDQPIYFQTNILVLAGCLIGLVVGIMVLNFPLIPIGRKR